MAWTKGLYEITRKISGGTKGVRDAARSAGRATKDSQTLKDVGPAMGKFAKYAAYPAGVGAGIGVGVGAAGLGASSAIDSTGNAVRNSWSPQDVKDAGGKLFGVLLLLIFVGGAVYLYRLVKGA